MVGCLSPISISYYSYRSLLRTSLAILRPGRLPHSGVPEEQIDESAWMVSWILERPVPFLRPGSTRLEGELTAETRSTSRWLERSEIVSYSLGGVGTRLQEISGSQLAFEEGWRQNSESGVEAAVPAFHENYRLTRYPFASDWSRAVLGASLGTDGSTLWRWLQLPAGLDPGIPAALQYSNSFETLG